jgi:hypothetical protein
LSILFMNLPLPLDLRALLQGAVFGGLVLVPFLAPDRWRIGRVLMLLAGGMLIHYLSVRLTGHLYGASALHAPLWVVFTTAGIAGALLVAALGRAVLPLRAGWTLWTHTALAGLAGGLLLGLPSLLHQGQVWSGGFVAWQVLVCAALCLESARPAAGPAGA